MNKIGLASVAVMALTGVASADFRGSTIEGATYGGDARFMGTFTAAELAARRGATERATSLYSSNWNSDSNGATYTVGNVAPNVAGTAAGQGGWFAYSSGTTANNTAVSNYRIAAGRPGGQTGQGLQIIGSSTGSGTRWMYQDLSAQWAARNAGDNIVWSEWSQFMASSSSASGNRAGGIFYDPTGSKILTGMATSMGTLGTSTTQRNVFGFANYNNAGTIGNFVFRLSGVTQPDSSVTPLAASGAWNYYAANFNKTTGKTEWYYSVDGGLNYLGFFVDGAAAGSDVAEWDYYVTTTSGNTTSSTTNYGNLTIYATPAPGAAALVGLAGLMARRRRA